MTAAPSHPASIAARSAHALPATAAKIAAAVFVVEGVVSLLAGDGARDHSSGLGLVSEALAGLAFVACAVCLGPLAPSGLGGRTLWLLAPVGLTIAGLTMLGVTVVGSEPAAWLFAASVIPTFVGTVAAGVLGARRGLWSWWTGAGLAALLPVMFLLPLNTFVMALTMAAVAFELPRARPVLK
jgi:hypothetical protein